VAFEDIEHELGIEVLLETAEPLVGFVKVMLQSSLNTNASIMLLNPPLGIKAHLWFADMVRNFARIGHGFEIPQQSY
jgi:hypothetical protein